MKERMSIRHLTKLLKKVGTALIVPIGTISLLIYTDTMDSLVRQRVQASSRWFEDRLFPMPDDRLIGINLSFYLSPAISKERSSEGMSVVLSPARCKSPEGVSLTRTFDDGNRDSFTDAIVTITSRASGRVSLTLTPRSGAAQVIYDSIVKDGEQVVFPGVAESFSSGLLILHLLDTKCCDGPWRPANSCQLDNSCTHSFLN